MQCHEVRLLLAFTERPCESVDAAEREAVAQHLKGCPDCTAYAQVERALDAALGRVMRDVPAPADLKPKVLKRLAASRGGLSWKWPAGAAAAAALLAIGLYSYFLWPLPVVTGDDVRTFVVQEEWNAERARQVLAEHGIVVNLPRDIDGRFLRTVEIVDFKGRRVAKLGYLVRAEEGSTSAIVLVLPHHQFRIGNIADTTIPGWELKIDRQDDCSYLIFFQGDLSPLRPPGA